MSENKDLDKFLEGMKKKYGDEILSIPKVEVITHPSIGLNVLTGIQGIPQGRIMEFYGPEGGGKSTIALTGIAAANRAGKRCFFIDLECALDKPWAEKLGVDWNLTTYIRPPDGEKAFDIANELIKSGFFSLGVFDSVAALVAEKELEKDLGDVKNQVAGFTAKIMSVGLKKLVPLASTHNVGMIFINQVRDNVGVLYGDPESTPGGRALKFYSSIRIRVNKFTGKDKVYFNKDIQIGHKCSIKIKKNKLSAPDSRDAEFNLYYEFGIDSITEIIEWSHKLNLLVKRGSQVTYQEKKYTLEEFQQALLDDNFRGELVQKIYENSRGDSSGTIEDEPVELEENLS